MEDDRAQVDLGIAADIEHQQAPESLVRQPKKRFVGRRTAAAASKNGDGSKSIEDAGAIQGRVTHSYHQIDLYNDMNISGPTKEGTSTFESGTSRDS